MAYAWDENKRRSNLAKHKLDFADAYGLFDNDHLIGTARTIDDERRQIAVGLIDDAYVTIVFTVRAGATRIISMRKARHEERKRYQEIYGRGIAGTLRTRREPQ